MKFVNYMKTRKMSKYIEYLLHNYLRSKGSERAYKQLLMALKCDLIYHTVKPKQR